MILRIEFPRGMRKEKILTAIFPEKHKGIEIGPLDRPTVTREMGEIRYVDHCTREELLEKYGKEPNINFDKIPDIDYVWGEKTLRDCIGPGEYFDYAIASHVIEHVPDLIGWLNEIEQILKDGGVLSLVIPDKRFTFDILRKESTPAEMIHAHLTKSRKPTPEQLFDCLIHYHEINLKGIWSGKDKPSDYPEKRLSLKEIYDICKKSLQPGEYIDNHCWVFTPYSFFELLKVAIELELISYKVIHFFPTAKNKHEFYVTLQKLPNSLDRKSEQLKSIPSIPNEYIEDIGIKKQFISSQNYLKYLGYRLRNKFNK